MAYNSIFVNKKKKRVKQSNETWDFVTNVQNKDLKVLSNHKGKLAINEAKKYLESQVDPIQDNVEKLLKLSANRISQKTTATLIKRVTSKKKSKKLKPTENVENTGFTEGDIKIFMEEYEKLE